jgi:hypothetical protein
MPSIKRHRLKRLMCIAGGLVHKASTVLIKEAS